MSKFTNISTATTTTILQASDHALSSANSLVGSKFFSVNKISITNYSQRDAKVVLYQHGQTVNSVTYDDYYIIGDANLDVGMVIPGGVTLVLDDSFTINLITHILKITNSGTDPALTIRID